MPSPRVRPTDTLTTDERDAVRSLAARATQSDGVGALSEQTLFDLAAGPGRVRHVLAYAGEQLVGYAQLSGGLADGGAGGREDGDGDEGPSGELVVDPDHRRTGIGRALLEAVLAEAGEVRLWAHGNLPAARALAAAAGLETVRELHKMSRALTPDDATSPATALPAGYTARAFEPGRDEQAWLATNAAAFAHHPEQGRMTLADLQDRMAQDWFDPAGFILVGTAEAPDAVAAFHWTKVDPEQRSTLQPGATAGEVYVVGVDPDHQGRGLGKPVTALGLAHLARLGLPEVVLYVDGDNAAAIRTYTGLGFRSIMVDVMYSRPVHRPL
ncbi:mycothiol synthase [Phycicoccus sp. M110.8]|uniref:mycothiol synthase n=1 Tax=Phycicoccus sp. M110.8 TaxID=3075433 RepID=UPI0028FD5EC6|nr:mycothiol synthase [Phycicoccus sp. M110.8]MDU0313351.1 mycothiol synthase [Phycicoccus sp. M110.8]